MQRSITIIITILTIILLSSVNILAYDLIVYSGEPEGVAAAVAAARNNLKTALVLERQEPGGLFSYGWLNFLDLNYDRQGNNINQGIFREWHKQVGGGVSFNIEAGINAFNNLLAAEKNLTLYKNHSLEAINKDSRRINSLNFKDSSGQRITLSGKYYIDASQNGELTYRAGNPYFFGGGDINQPERFMPVTPVIKIKNINRDRLIRDAGSGRHGHTVVNQDNAYGFAALGARYQPDHPKAGLRGLNLVLEDKTIQGETVTFGYINALHFYGVDGTDQSQLDELQSTARAEASRVVKFLKDELEGMKNAEFVGIADEFYVRETRHFVTENQLNVKDQLSASIPEDTVALASYPLDYQSYAPENSGFVYFNPGVYGIPLGSLIPVDFDNLLIVGRSSGQSSIAHSSGRIIPNGMSAAEGAGVAVAKAVKNKINPGEVAKSAELMAEIQTATGLTRQINSDRIQNLQEKTLNQNYQAYLEPVSELLSWGLIVGGYDNNFQLQENLAERTFVYLLLNGLKNRDAELEYANLSGKLTAISSTASQLNYNKVEEIVEIIRDYAPDTKKQEFIEILNNWKNNFNIDNSAYLTRGQIYHLAVAILNQFELSEELKLYRNY